MQVPEYFSLFSGEGEFSVEVKFKSDGFVQPRRATVQAIAGLMDAEAGTFHTALTFDEHLFEVYKYEIDPLKKKLVIHARKHD